MRGKKRKKRVDVSNQRLDLFFRKIEFKKTKEVVQNVENLTNETLKGLSTPQLRLKKSPHS